MADFMQATYAGMGEVTSRKMLRDTRALDLLETSQQSN